MNKRGISDVVMTVLMILIVVVAVAGIWVYVSSFLGKTSEVNTNVAGQSITVQPKSVKIYENGSILFNIKLEYGNSVNAIAISLADNSGNTKVIYRNLTLNVLDIKSVYIDSTEHGIAEIDKVSVSPLIKTQSGATQTAGQGVEYNINEADEIKPICGNAIVERGEQCDNGTINGVIPTPSYNNNLSYCDSSCQMAIARGLYCGDSSCSGGETPVTCSLDCASVCGDGIASGSEQCDGTDFKGLACKNQTGYKYGTLSCTSSCTLGSSACFPLNSSERLGLVAYYSLSEGSGATLNDWSGNGNTATLIGNPIWTTGNKNNATTFDGSTQYISTTINLNTSKDFTYLVWIKTNCPDRSGLEGCSLFHDGDGGARSFETWVRGGATNLFGQFSTADGSAYPSTNGYGGINCLTPNQWNQVAFVYSSKKLYAYTNGNTTPTIQMPLNITDRNTYLKIGRDWGCCGSWFIGSMDEIGIWNRSLTASEIADLYS